MAREYRTIEEIAETAEYNKKCFQELGLDETTEFVLGSSFQLEPDYTDKVYQLATMTTLKRARRMGVAEGSDFVSSLN